MSELTERLRALGDVRTSALYHQRVILNGAADEIDRLTRELAEARDKALEEAAVLIEQRDGQIPDRQELAAEARALKEKT